jgi:hypothetical protein
VSKANDRQVGGTHYAAPIQHWDYAASHDFDYFQGQITKYVTRWKKKGGVQDLEKAAHFLAKYIELARAAADPNGEVFRRCAEREEERAVVPFAGPHPDGARARAERVNESVPMRRRTKSEVRRLQTEGAVYGGCCNRFADMSGCDCLATAAEDSPYMTLEEYDRRNPNPTGCTICRNPNCDNPNGQH